MTHSPETLLDALMSATPRRTAEAPNDARGLCGLVDHFGDGSRPASRGGLDLGGGHRSP